MTRLLMALLLLLVSVTAHAQQTSTPVKGFRAKAPAAAPVPPAAAEVDKAEVLRRGNMVQAVGTVQQSTIDVIAESLQTPADDSGKWYLTVITQNDCPPCEALKKAFASAPELRIWANPTEQDKSWSHYHVRDLDDPTQAAWFKGVRQQIEKTPAILIQPPRSNQYGDHTTTVEILIGYDGDPQALSDEIRKSIVTYVAAIQAPQEGVARSALQAKPRGHQQSTTPPFMVPSDPFEIDPSAPAPVLRRNQHLTIEQIQMAVQGVQGPGFLAPAEFVLSMLQTGVRTAAEVQQAWLQFLARRPQPQPDPQPTPATPTVVPVTPVQPSTPSPSATDLLGELLKLVKPQPQPAATPSPVSGVMDLVSNFLNLGSWAKYILGFFGLTSVASVVLQWLSMWRGLRKASGQPTILTDEQFSKLQDLAKALDANTAATSLNSSVASKDLQEQLLKILRPAS